MPGAARQIAVASAATAASTCSQLSQHQHQDLPRTASVAASRALLASLTSMFSVCATVLATRADH